MASESGGKARPTDAKRGQESSRPRREATTTCRWVGRRTRKGSVPSGAGGITRGQDGSSATEVPGDRREPSGRSGRRLGPPRAGLTGCQASISGLGEVVDARLGPPALILLQDGQPL